MLRAWRIVRDAHAASAFDGEGARLYGGRWNPPGLAAVYVSEHASLAALEILVHTQPLIPAVRYSAFEIEFDEGLVEHVTWADLPEGWNESPPMVSMQVGGRWLREAGSAVLAVPSAVLPLERNFVLNPRHPDFGKIHIAKPQRFAFDPRLLDR